MDRGVLRAVKTHGVIRVSLGTAAVLGLLNLRCDVLPTTAYLLTTGGCTSRCAFCAQAITSKASESLLSRVSWPEFPIGSVLEGLSRGNPVLRRVCIQVTSTPDARSSTIRLVNEILKVRETYGSDYRISLSYHPSSISDVGSILSQGVDRIGIALDAASKRIYDKVKMGGASWDSTMRLLEESAQNFRGKISTHLIVGLGETEEELAKIMQQLQDLGITIGLFAFTPIRGTPMEQVSQPRVDTYRRAQIARYLITAGHVRSSDFTFVNGRISGFGLASEELKRLINTGIPFETSGCPDCNRPYYNERPGGVLFNYPRPLYEAEIGKCLLEAGLQSM